MWVGANASGRIQCLLPLANTPLIEYTFEFLANAGVEEVFLYGGAHSDQLEKYIKYVREGTRRGRNQANVWHQRIKMEGTLVAVQTVDLPQVHVHIGR